MRRFMLAVAAASLIPTSLAIPADQAEAKRYKYREWRGKDGRYYCRKTDGTVGLIVGAGAGALLGRAIDTEGDRAAGTIIGAGAGALIGREIDRERRCR